MLTISLLQVKAGFFQCHGTSHFLSVFPKGAIVSRYDFPTFILIGKNCLEPDINSCCK